MPIAIRRTSFVWFLTAAALPLILLLVLLGPFTPTGAIAAPADGVWYVDAAKTSGANDGSSWADAFSSLQSALDVVQSGDEIWVAQGVYTPTKRTEPDDPRSATFALVNGVSLYGGFSGAPGTEGDMSGRDWEAFPTVLSGDIGGDDVVDGRGVVTDVGGIVGENVYHVVTAEGVNEETVFAGFFVTGGQAIARSSSEQKFGGGMYSRDSSTNIVNVAFIANFAHGLGGGMYNLEGNSTLTSVTFLANQIECFYRPDWYWVCSGGGMHSEDSDLKLTNVTFLANSVHHSREDVRGGGMYNEGGSLELNSVTFMHNSLHHSSSAAGGGMYVRDGNAAFKNVFFTGNQITQANLCNGGGLYSYSNLGIANATFRANSVDCAETGYGGGLYNSNILKISNALFVANSTSYAASALANYDGEFNANNITAVRNYAPSGGSIVYYSSEQSSVKNSIIWGNVPDKSQVTASNSQFSVEDSLIEGGCSRRAICYNIIDVAPLLVRLPHSGDGDWSTLEDNDYGDLRLRPGSPAINSSNNDSLPTDALDLDEDGNTTELLPFDIAGNPRIINDTVDMGAYETFGLNVSKLADPNVVKPGDIITYTIAFQNSHDAVNIIQPLLIDEIPSEILVEEIEYDGITMTNISTAPYQWQAADLSPGSRGQITIRGHVKEEVNPLSDIQNTVEITYTASEPSPAQTTSEASIHVSGIIYVDAAKTDGANDGSSWADAFIDLQSALDVAQTGDEIWVAQGVYAPTKRIEIDDPRSATFSLVSGVSLYGGFSGAPGTEGDMGERDWEAFPTVLSGDIGGDDVMDARGVITDTANIVGGNAYRVLTGRFLDSNTRLDGFIITAGKSNGIGGGMYNYFSDLQIANIIFSANHARSGGGMYNAGSDLMIGSSRFFANVAEENGGGAYVLSGKLKFINVTFEGNRANRGGGMYNKRGALEVVNIVFNANSALQGGGLYEIYTSTLVNVLFSNNNAVAGGGVYGELFVPRIINATFAFNRGGDIESDIRSRFTEINNAIFWGGTQQPINIDGTVFDKRIVIRNSLFAGGCPVDIAICDHVIDIDPLFVRNPNPDEGDYGDFRLRSDSAAVDFGNNSWLPVDDFDLDGDGDISETVPFDLAGDPRVFGRAVDLGAYETYGLRLSKTIEPAIALPGDNITYTIEYKNFHDTSTIEYPQLLDDISSDIEVQSIQSSGVAITRTADNPHQWQIADLLPSDGGKITIRGRVKQDVDQPSTIENTAILFYTIDSSPITITSQAPLHLPGIYYVDATKTGGANTGDSWMNGFTNLQLALDLAQRGDEIWVAQGVYTPTKRIEPDDPRSTTFALVNGVSLYGGFPGTPGTEGDMSGRDWEAFPTVLSGDIGGDDAVDGNGIITDVTNIKGENAYHVLLGHSIDKDTVVNGFVVTGGATERNGGGLFGEFESSPSLSDMFFVGSTAQNGGGLFTDFSSCPKLTNIVVEANQATRNGGGLFHVGECESVLTHVEFVKNVAGDSGGGVFSGENLVLQDVVFQANSARFGGGLASRYNTPTLINVSFFSNHAEENGGGMYRYSIYSGRLTNIVFSGNSAGVYGGGLFDKNVFYDNNYDHILSNATFVANYAGEQGGGVYGITDDRLWIESGTSIHNTIIWGNTPDEIGIFPDTPSTIIDSLIDGGCPENATCTGLILDADPRFARSPDPGDGDWSTLEDNDYGDLRLRPDSPTIDAGSNQWLPFDTYDLDGDGDTEEPIPYDVTGVIPRIVGTQVDMGAHEYIALPESFWLPVVLR